MATVKRFDANQAPAKVTSEILDRQPPRSLEAERAVLGSMLLLPDVCDDVALVLRGDDFYDEAHRRLYATCGRCTTRAAHDRLDPAGRAAEECRRFRIRRRHGLSGRGACNRWPRRPTPSITPKSSATRSTLRSLIHSSTEILRDAYDESIDPREMLARAEQKIFSILDSRGAGELERHRQTSCRMRWRASTPG